MSEFSSEKWTVGELLEPLIHTYNCIRIKKFNKILYETKIKSKNREYFTRHVHQCKQFRSTVIVIAEVILLLPVTVCVHKSHTKLAFLQCLKRIESEITCSILVVNLVTSTQRGAASII